MMKVEPSEPISSADHAKRTSRYDWARRWVSGLTFERAVHAIQTFALIGGIAIALDQTIKLRESIDTATWSSLAAQLTEVDKLFIEHPEMVPYFYDGVPVAEDHPDYAKAYSLAVLVIDFMDSSYVMGKHIDPAIFEPDAWERFYKYQFESSPIICRVIRDEADIYGAGIIEASSRYCPPSPFPAASTRRPSPPESGAP